MELLAKAFKKDPSSLAKESNKFVQMQHVTRVISSHRPPCAAGAVPMALLETCFGRFQQDYLCDATQLSRRTLAFAAELCAAMSEVGGVPCHVAAAVYPSSSCPVYMSNHA